MRTITDDGGRVWDVAVGRESWGTLVLLFSSRDNENRTALLSAETLREAERELADMSDGALRERLAGSKPWE